MIDNALTYSCSLWREYWKIAVFATILMMGKKKVELNFSLVFIGKSFLFCNLYLAKRWTPYIIKKTQCNSSRIMRQECLKNCSCYLRKVNWIFHQGKEKPQKETFLCFYPCLYKAKRIILCDRRCLICKCSQA